MVDYMLKFGVMQGRLTNKGGFFPQSFPWNNWQKEFLVAKELGFDCIEWMFNADMWEENPVITDEGVINIQKCIDNTGISVSGICANFFMENSIYNDTIEMKKRNIKILNTLVKNAGKIGCSNIILPMFGSSGDFFERKSIWEQLYLLLGQLESGNVNILIETDAPIHIVKNFIDEIPDGRVGICYDMGNAAGLGKNVLSELRCYSNLIGEYHIKDKKNGESTVMLGKGDVPYKECMNWLLEYEHKALLILESYYGLNAIEDTKKNLQYIKDQMER